MISPYVFTSTSFFLDSGQLEQQLEEASSARRELDDASRQIKAFEKQIRGLKQEREDLNKVKSVILVTLLYFILNECSLNILIS